MVDNSVVAVTRFPGWSLGAKHLQEHAEQVGLIAAATMYINQETVDQEVGRSRSPNNTGWAAASRK